jgi:alkanesulfonate monooxygenase SsuD/methylene tetrahydromethanopterin reductase-like flavin-dependent oxidoreductase (luciferase family)
MKFGVLTPNWEPFSYNVKFYEEIATYAEKFEYDSFFVTDHYLRPFLEVEPNTIKRHATIEAWSLLAYITAKTEFIRIGSCVTPLPMRNPAILAKIISTIDNLSNGRVIFGVGAGYERREFEAYAHWEPPNIRVLKVKEALILMKKLWTEDIVDFEGKFFKVKRAVLEPKPVQKPHPPIWVGAMHEKMFHITVELADGWIPARSLGATPEFYAENSKKILSLAKKLGRKIMLGLMGYITDEGFSTPLPSLATIKDVKRILEQYKNLGCEYFIAVFFPIEKYITLMKKFRQEIIPSFS